MARDLWKNRSLPPSWLYGLTPHEILFLFGEKPAEEEIDPVAELWEHNRNRAAKGLPPTVPSWLMPEVPRGR